ncbi:NADH-FMN oxidoreductase RutF, flavin reductase (DIM6/NTAB) family [Cohaesibacter sp. ES.047]|uniref:flavin reductase family protein n=1 Tax=Cohaesibacter sp. ES.047 TaxID=1798205 RepID=UPI000BB95C1E|nr:flavin reductase family protein [Cohaesibacter sp. ES.047]SNY93864.1 NADH-FMN oxidoreductase RutF, flavin reductase (DIM6/NTAB) family [Cohaesibacter sp. ES.047]
MIEPDQFRKALGQFATGIAIATTLDEHGNPHGLTINSFNSVSLDPPLVLWSLDKSSHQLDIFKKSGFYGVTILAEDQKALSDRFAMPMIEDRFDGTDWQSGKTGAPLFNEFLARIDCEVESIVEGGDHVILIGRVVDLEHREGAPLLYHGSGYRKLGDAVTA